MDPSIEQDKSECELLIQVKVEDFSVQTNNDPVYKKCSNSLLVRLGSNDKIDKYSDTGTEFTTDEKFGAYIRRVGFEAYDSKDNPDPDVEELAFSNEIKNEISVESDVSVVDETEDIFVVNISDTVVPVETRNRALLTAPKGLTVTWINGKVNHVRTMAFLPNGVTFGPYEGCVTHTATQTGIHANVFVDDKLYYIIDGADLRKSNWMRCVPCTSVIQDQNMEAFQYEMNIYFKTIKDIPANSELQLGCSKYITALCKQDIAESLWTCVPWVSSSVEENQRNIKEYADDSQLCECCICQQQFSQFKQLEQHTSDHIGIKPCMCVWCNIYFTHLYDLKEHINGHKTLFVDCHMLVEHGKLTFKCTLCSKIIKRRSSMVTHVRRRHLKKTPYKCSACEKTYSQQCIMKEHEQIRQIRSGEIQKCPSRKICLIENLRLRPASDLGLCSGDIQPPKM